MINVEMTDDIRKYKVKSFGPFSAREAVFLTIGCLYSFPIAAMWPTTLENKVLIFAILAAPVAMCGFTKMSGGTAEVIALRFLYLYLLTPARRKYKAINTFRADMNAYKNGLEKLKISSLTPKQQKAYLKKKEAAKKVRYSNKKEYKVYR